MKLASLSVLPLAVVAACAEQAPPAVAPPPSSAPETAPGQAKALKATPVPLPGATGAVSLDYLAVDRNSGRVWIPAGGTGSVDILDTATGKLTQIQGFPTVERETHAGKRLVGPSSATIGGGFAYVGNRASGEVCAVDAVQLRRSVCVVLPSPPDGLAYVGATKEVWATTPRNNSITVIDASAPGKLAIKATIPVAGKPEGYAVDERRGVFFTNLEDKDKTLAIDVRTRTGTGTWEAHCGSEGPRGLALDEVNDLLFVACTTGVQVLDAGRGGKALAQVSTGAGVDNIDYLEGKRQLYVAAGKAAMLTILHVDEQGALAPIATAATAEGARVVVAAADGSAYVADGAHGQVLVFPPPSSQAPR